MHTRGRAIDNTSSWSTVNLYQNVYSEFKGSYSTPQNYSTLIWRSLVEGTTAALSGAYAIEKMPQSSQYWLHLETAPHSDLGY